MSTFTQLVNDVLQSLHGYGLSQDRAAHLIAAADADGLTMTLSNVSNFEQGLAEIESELVFIESVDDASGVITISPDGRGYYGTTAAAHAINKRITMAPTWSRQRVVQALNEAIVGTHPMLFGVASTTFTFSPAVNTYELPAECERVIRVTADTIGPTKEQITLNRYSFNSAAPTATFATGNTITLEKGAFPGRGITVTYAKQPTELVEGDDFTECGLRESAKVAIKYAACSNLVAWMDTARLPVHTTQADSADGFNPAGRATDISTKLYQRYLIELESERRRQAQAYPATISVRTR